MSNDPAEKVDHLTKKLVDISERLNKYIQGNGSSKKLKAKCQDHVNEIKKLTKAT